MNREYGPEVTDEQKREDGINMNYPSRRETANETNSNLVFPNLTDCKTWSWRNEAPKSCFNQGIRDMNDVDEDSDEAAGIMDMVSRRNFGKLTIRTHKTDKYDGWPNGVEKP